MSVQFGRWSFDGRPVDTDYLEKAKALLAPYGPDASSSYQQASIGILYHTFHTTEESRRETQPYVTPCGDVISWDGRLDNRAELTGELRSVLTIRSTDVAIFAAAYERWGTECLAKLLGDWAVSIWSPIHRSLLLAKDPIGTQHLYYSLDKDHVSWSSILDPLVLLAGKSFALEEEYIAGWLSFFPATHLTPYVGIHSVPPSSFVLLSAENHAVNRYWDFDPGTRIRYRTDAEYEEHFRAAFGESVRRRLRSDHPILAELSGGMDSSSIVCMADTIIAQGATEAPRVDTISYYDDSEPNWNERPYLTKVEAKRGRVGCQIDVGSRWSLNFKCDDNRFAATPDLNQPPNEVTKQFAACMTSQGNRVVLSGIGGDEVTGGVPTPIPELQDLLARARFKTLVRQLTVWALNKREPWFHLLFEAVRGFLPPGFAGVPKHQRPAAWLDPNFAKRNRKAVRGYEERIRVVGAMPSFQDSLNTLNVLRRQLACECLSSEPLCEKRYPYLDRGLLEFLYAIPREQLVRPGQRRSLMRRALVGVVPDQILQRKRKAFISRGPSAIISAEWASLFEISRHMVSTSLGIVVLRPFSEALRKAREGAEIPIVPLTRALRVEFWVRELRERGILKTDMPLNAKDVSCRDPEVLMGPLTWKEFR